MDATDDWGAAAVVAVSQHGADADRWGPLLAHAATAIASKPTKKWLAAASAEIDALGEERFATLAATLLGALDAPASGEMRRGTGIGAYAGLDRVPRAVPTEHNALLLRGLVWACSVPGGADYAALVGTAASACAKKIPDVGARSPKVLNACLWTLGAIGEDGAPYLVQLSQRARKPAARRRVELALDSAASTAGISREALELGALREAKPAVQRRYFERAMASGAEWSWGRFRDEVLGHDALSSLAGPLILAPHGGAPFLALRGPGTGALPDTTPVRLWHPAGKPVGEVLAWREVLESELLVQPFKQAHREVYLLTPVERDAGFESARFTGHVVRQHTLSALCEARGWKYRLQGSFDPGFDADATIALPRHDLVAQLVVEPVDDRSLGSGSGIFLYAQTGRVSFRRPARRGARVELEQVPSLILSEVLRDVDLFTSVAGLAADPKFPLTAPEPWPRIWRERAYDELTPLGHGRRELLEKLIPALPIAAQLELAERFLIVRGTLHTYRIHLGSANVIMEPDSRHLCILPAGGRRRPGERGHVWLPFEGDETLAQILSKAILLAADDAIDDPSIRAQL